MTRNRPQEPVAIRFATDPKNQDRDGGEGRVQSSNEERCVQELRGRLASLKVEEAVPIDKALRRLWEDIETLSRMTDGGRESTHSAEQYYSINQDGGTQIVTNQRQNHSHYRSAGAEEQYNNVNESTGTQMVTNSHNCNHSSGNYGPVYFGEKQSFGCDG